ncbi:MAG: Ppx/GppA family phosphatase [Proteobacteria bacterium]|nr:Ppx/GppA family phosphatase [Pseudomonadota bacterium]
MRRASIDLGTNTCLLLVKEEAPGGELILHDESNVVRLGEGVAASGLLNEAAMKRARDCLLNYVRIAGNLGVPAREIVAAGTAQARDARNAKDFFNDLEAALGLRFRILSGADEARATFLGARVPGIEARQMVVMDIGGGSTEIVAMPEAQGSVFGESLGIGAVKITEKFLSSDPVTDREFWSAEEAINLALSKLKPWRRELDERLKGEPRFVAVAGTAVTLAMVQKEMSAFDPRAIDGSVLTRGDAHRLVEELKWRSVEETKAMPGMEAKRADVILAGALIFWRVMEELGFKEAVISTRGLRYGILDPEMKGVQA